MKGLHLFFITEVEVGSAVKQDAVVLGSELAGNETGMADNAEGHRRILLDTAKLASFGSAMDV